MKTLTPMCTVVLLILVACGGEVPDSGADDASDVDEEWTAEFVDGVVDSEPAESSDGDETGLEVGQWAVVTSVQDSSGNYLQGMHHRERSVPDFMDRFDYHGVDADSADTPGYLPMPVTQNIQHSATYLYGDDVDSVQITTALQDGIATGVYPSPLVWSAPDPLSDIAGGELRWDVDIVGSEQAEDELHQSTTGGLWETSRDVSEAAYVESAGDYERFIGHRGITTFEPPISVEHLGNRFYVTNGSEVSVDEILLIKVRGDVGYVGSVGPIPGNGVVEFSPAPKEMPSMPLDVVVSNGKNLLSDHLQSAGLSEAMASTIVDAWLDQWLGTQGDRLLYVFPDAWTEELMPLNVTPEPDHQVRSVLGRIELTDPDTEEAIADAVQMAYNEEMAIDEVFGQTLSEPRLRAGCPRIDSATIESWCIERADEIATETVDAVTY